MAIVVDQTALIGGLMTWLLFVILLESERYIVAPQGLFIEMNDCFEARDYFLATAPQPKINYEAVCIPSDVVEMN
jgi:hypothetical protein